MLTFTAAPSNGVPSWNVMPSRMCSVHSRVVLVGLDRLDEQRHGLALVGDLEQGSETALITT